MKFFRLATLLSLLVAPSATASSAPTAADPAALDQKEYSVIIAGGTPGGLATAIRCARQGLSVLLVNHTHHLGGMLSNGLGVLDAYYYKARSPIYDEMTARLVAHYEGREFDPQSYTRSNVGQRLHMEPHVIERILNDMLAAESVTVVLGHTVKSIIKEGNSIRALRFGAMEGDSSFLVFGSYFVDATYEGDLAALAGVPYRVGREAKAEFGEPRAGVHFSRLVEAEPRPAAIRDLQVPGHHVSTQGIPHPRNGEGDNAILAYNFRLALSRDPENRYLPPKPANYDPEAYQIIKERLYPLPDNGRFANGAKITGWNAPNLPGGNHDYPTASWERRRKIAQTHLDWAIGILYYFQQDRDEPLWGLAKDEFTDNGHVPWEMYVREARRIQGVKVFTEHDGLLSAQFNRAPIHFGSIAITEWSLDSHACTTDRYLDSRPEGKVLLSEETVPGQVDFRCLIATEANNLIVPVCLSSTHVGWGTIRLEPTWMQIAEAAGFALAQASATQASFLKLDINQLQRTLAEQGFLLTYFDDIEILQPDAFVPAIQYLGTKGFFPEYEARAQDPLDAETAMIWLKIASELLRKQESDPNQHAALLANFQPDRQALALSADGFLQLSQTINSDLFHALEREPQHTTPQAPLTRGEACLWVYRSLK